MSLLLFAENNFSGECTLREAAKNAGYDYVYTSKTFKARLGIPFKKYVNMLRIHKATELLHMTKKSMYQIACECGFGCFRSFNREFLNIVGVSPSLYRKTHMGKD